MTKIYLATDHAGFDLKERLKEFLNKKIKENDANNFSIIEDCGAFKENKDDDYTDFISIAANSISNSWACSISDSKSKDNSKDLAIIMGGSGQGEAMMANRFQNVRATVYYAENKEILKLSKIHNNANILSIGARFFKEEQIDKLFNDIWYWINLEFTDNSRHKRRVRKMDMITDEFYGLINNEVKKEENNKNFTSFLKNVFKNEK